MVLDSELKFKSFCPGSQNDLNKILDFYVSFVGISVGVSFAVSERLIDATNILPCELERHH
jgi:hypothetical protein